MSRCQIRSRDTATGAVLAGSGGVRVQPVQSHRTDGEQARNIRRVYRVIRDNPLALGMRDGAGNMGYDGAIDGEPYGSKATHRPHWPVKCLAVESVAEYDHQTPLGFGRVLYKVLQGPLVESSSLMRIASNSS